MVRFKNRYLVVELNSFEDNILDFKINDREIQSTVINAIKLMYGDFGVGAIQTCFKVRYCNLATKIIIFKTRHGPHKFLLSAIPLINKFKEKNIQLSTLYAGASVFQCHKFIQRYQNDLIRKSTYTINAMTRENILNATGTLKFSNF